MFYTFAIVSMIGFALQNTLLVRYARRMDGLTLGFYRNTSFVITLLPFLIGVNRQDFVAVLSRWPLLITSSVCGGLALWSMFSAYQYISVGVSRSLSRAVTTVLIAGASWVLLGETLSLGEGMVIAVIVILTIFLGLLRNPMDHLDNNLLKGFFLVFASSIFIGITKFVLALLSRSVDPLTGAYFWEVGIAVAIFGIALVRKVFFGQSLQRIPVRDKLGIAVCASPTLIATGGFVLALNMGPVAIAETIGSTAVVLSSFLAHWLYKEKLSSLQWLLMMLILCGLAALKFV